MQYQIANLHNRRSAVAELTRWRSARSVQRRVLSDLSTFTLPEPSPEASPERLPARVARRLARKTGRLVKATDQNDQFANNIDQFDQWLVSVNDRPQTLQLLDVEIASLFVLTIADEKITDVYWLQAKQNYSDALYQRLEIVAANSQANPTATQDAIKYMAAFTRLLLLMSLIETRLVKPAMFATVDDVYAALRWRSLLLPSAVLDRIFAARRNAIPPLFTMGFTDLYVVNEEWQSYQPGEVADVENVMQGESKAHIETTITELKSSVTAESSLTTASTDDSKVTDSAQVQESSNKDISQATHIDGQVDTSASYGPVQLSVHVGGSSDYSSATSQARAVTQAHETVDRVVKQVVQTTQQIRTSSTFKRTADKQSHKFDNTAGTGPVVGIYRWIDQVQQMELRRYRNRFVLEFEVPEPGSWIRWAYLGKTADTPNNPAPVPFTVDGSVEGVPLSADIIAELNYLKIASRYQATGLLPPTAATISLVLSIANQTDQPKAASTFTDASIICPDGYMALNYTGFVQANYGAADGSPGFVGLILTVGSDMRPSYLGTVEAPDVFDRMALTPIGGNPQGPIPVSVIALNWSEFSIGLTFTFQRTSESWSTWQSQTYDALAGAYQTLQQNYLTALASVDPASDSPVSIPDDMAANIIKRELKRNVLQMLMGQPFNGRNAVVWDGTSKAEPIVDLTQAAVTSSEIKFLEQAFEWEALSYICYPYFWTDPLRWKTLFLISNDGSQMSEFLRSGSARVVVPARPGFELQVAFYAVSGVLWGGGPPPAPNDADYLSVADEIKDIQGGNVDYEVADTWNVTVPTTLIWLENPTALPSVPVVGNPQEKDSRSILGRHQLRNGRRKLAQK